MISAGVGNIKPVIQPRSTPSGIAGALPVSLPGKLFAEGTSSYFIGNVEVSLPEGFTFPVSTSAMELPVSCPPCHASRMASGISRHEAVSITPPILRITITFLPFAWKAFVTFSIISFSMGRSLKSPSTFLRSCPSPAFRPMVIMAASHSSDRSEAESGSTPISEAGLTGYNNSWMESVDLTCLSFPVFM